ncbi:hypothetical protein Riv7116_2876 [Rivularia sp. PCC 7116]|uniref:DUF6326 family protein n=1 Tax=Rivularia sp. PCC 7116 TaxID=373994 RepID=UPI00029EEFEB|nr:DUF6326 family protein [Rivularia sp. PCC 7116]AFY55373.1 hypothetical protein Riv7116_2876 [Rivularia sp. PCC 7116]
MISNHKTIGMDIKALLSTLWIFVLFNMIFRDLHEFGRPGFLEEIMTGIVNGVQITEGLMLIGGIMAEIPISMVLLSRVLKYKINRWANIIAGAITIAIIIQNGVGDLDDMFFATIEIVSLSVIVWCAWKWHK